MLFKLLYMLDQRSDFHSACEHSFDNLTCSVLKTCVYNISIFGNLWRPTPAKSLGLSKGLPDLEFLLFSGKRFYAQSGRIDKSAS